MIKLKSNDQILIMRNIYKPFGEAQSKDLNGIDSISGRPEKPANSRNGRSEKPPEVCSPKGRIFFGPENTSCSVNQPKVEEICFV